MPTTKSSKHWLAIFQANAAPRTFGDPRNQLTAIELATIRRSIQEFQLGESGEGLHIIRQAKYYAARTGDTDYLLALRLFIAEEIRHSKELQRFMITNDIPTFKHTFVDSIFRTLRRAAGLELSIAVLVCAEIIAKVYYAALRDATRSPHLRALCTQILLDEITHVQFQSERLAILRRLLPRRSQLWRSFLYPLFFRTTLLVVWLKHAKVFHAAHYPITRYWRESLTEFQTATQIMTPQNYIWPREPVASAPAQQPSLQTVAPQIPTTASPIPR